MVRNPSNRSHNWEDSESTGFLCSKCNSVKRRCMGCGKIICRCDKRNDHIVGNVFYLCFKPLKENKG